MNYFFQRSKYGNKKVIVDGIKFDSKKEATRYGELLLMERAGLIKDIALQQKFLLLDTFKDKFGKTHRSITYITDFTYVECDDGQKVAEDSKGFKTADFKIKEKLFCHAYPDYKLIIS